MVTDEQVRLLRQRRMEGKKQEAAAAAAGMSVRTAREWEEGPLPSEVNQERWWRTRGDPFVDVWATDVVALLESDPRGALQAKTILEELQRRHPGQFYDGQVRTLQRRIRDWRALHGPAKEVFFQQEHVPGREGAFDFTDMRELNVTVGGVVYMHLMFVLRLSFSGWTWTCGAVSESFEALVHGVQGAVWALGGSPRTARSDNLSAATHELREGGRTLTRRFRAFLEHYGMSSSRINAGKSNENGGVEKENHLLKRAIEQALLLRGSRDFETEAAYWTFVDEIVAKLNARTQVQERLAIERAQLLPLPSTRVPEYTKWTPKVRLWSTIQVNKRTYSVPSRLIGHTVEARQHPDFVEVLYKGRVIEKMPRIRGSKDARIDYRHVIWSLVTKPGAFARYRFREELFPTLTFRRAYDALREQRGERSDVEYVRILHLAASTMESLVERALGELLDEGAALDFATVKARVVPREGIVPVVTIKKPDLSAYDALLGGAR
jgi:hypothetical protein